MKPITKLRGFTKPRNRLTLRGPHLDNLTFNFKGATRRSAPFRFTSPCLKCDPLAARPQPATLVIGDVLKRLVKGDTLDALGTWGRSFCAGSLGHSLRKEAGVRQPVLIAAKNRPVLG